MKLCSCTELIVFHEVCKFLADFFPVDGCPKFSLDRASVVVPDDLLSLELLYNVSLL